MGRKKKRSTAKKTKRREFDLDIAVIICIILAILTFGIIFFRTGAAGEILSPALGGILGGIKYIIPFGFLALAYAVAKDEGKYLKSKLLQYLIFLGLISSVLTIYQISNGNIDKTKGFESVVQAAYTLGVLNKGGGTIGAVISYPLVMLFNEFGAAVVALGGAAVLLVFTFGIHPSEIIRDWAERFEDSRDEKREEEEARRAERNQRREDRKESRRTSRIQKVSEENANNTNTNVRQVKDFASEEIVIPEDQIKINLNDGSDKLQDEPVKKGMFKGILRKNDKAEIIEQKPNPNELTSNIFKQEEVVKENKTKEVLQLEHNTIAARDENYEYPPTELMKQGSSKSNKAGKKAYTDTALRLQKTLHSFGVSAKVENVSVGPAITRYELKPAEGVRVSKIAKLSDDIALNLAAESIRIEAPIPGKQAVGIEIPNTDKEIVHLRDIIESEEFIEKKSKLAFALGKNVAGEIVVTDIAKMPHVLIAGSTGSGKSVCINTLITSIIYKAKPSEVKLVMVDPKVVELSVYNGIPHLLIPVVTDPKKAAGALAWAVQEMVNRYALFAEKGVRDIAGYNEALEKENVDGGSLPHIVIIIDELADLMMVAPNDVEDAICRLAQMARAAGMHLVIATQRPSVDVITGIIKANIPSRIAFAVSSQVDSRTILDGAGAEKLLGKGDMLFYPIGAPKPIRVQGAFVSDKEVENIVGFVKSNGTVTYNEDILESIEKANKSDKEKDMEQDEEDDVDPFLNDAIETVIDIGQASTSFIQRRFKVGYARAGRIIDQMEARGIISGYEGSKPRQVLMSKERWQELNMMPQDRVGDNNE